VGLRETHGIELNGAEIAAGSRRRSPLGLADRPTVCFCFCFLGLLTHSFFFLAMGLATSPRPRRCSAQTSRGDPPRNKLMTGHLDPRLGLAGCGFGFFLVLG
jgi:hypothetical protein